MLIKIECAISSCKRFVNILDGYTVAWGGDVSGDFDRKTGTAELPAGTVPTQEMRQEQWDDWRFTYDHVMLIYGKAVDEKVTHYYMVKNSWGDYGPYKGIWYMSRDYMKLNTTYIFLQVPLAFLYSSLSRDTLTPAILMQLM